jgi:hypothetical protein
MMNAHSDACELVGNLHSHTVFSDGAGTHKDIGRGALKAGLDFVVVTDHNVYVDGVDGYQYKGDRRVLLLAGEEIHDPNRKPQRNHLLTYEARRELATQAASPQRLINAVNKAGGLAFLAHPDDPPAPLFEEDSLSWVTWDIEGFNGLEIWNFMSEYKAHLTSWPEAIYFAFRPDLIPTRPPAEVLARWDRLLSSGQKVVAIGGADAHAWPVRKGPLKRVVFPYEYLFGSINTHVLTPAPLSGEMDADRQMIFSNLREGRAFVANDRLAPARGFRFTAQSRRGLHQMGDSVSAGFGVTLQVRLPQRAHVRLIRHGRELRAWDASAHAVATVSEPGAYRVEALLWAHGRARGWIYSNPIFVTA